MIRILFCFIFLVSFNIQNEGFTKLKDPSLCKKNLKEKSIATNTLSANFSEKKTSKIYNTPKIGKGILLFKKSNKIRWEHTEPISQIILIDGKNIKFQENKIEQKNPTTTKIVKKIQNLMLNLIDGSFLESNEFDILYFNSDHEYKLELKPKSKKIAKYIEKIELFFNNKTFLLNELTIFESETDKIEYKFSNISINKEILNSKFTTF